MVDPYLSNHFATLNVVGLVGMDSGIVLAGNTRAAQAVWTCSCRYPCVAPFSAGESGDTAMELGSWIASQPTPAQPMEAVARGHV